MVPEEALGEIETVVSRLGPRAEILRTTHSAVDPAAILATGRFDFEDATRAPGWKRELAADDGDGDSKGDGHERADHARGHDHDHDQGHSAADAHGVSSFVYRESRPFHPERFEEWIEEWAGDVIRAKGFFHLAGRERAVMGLSRAGQSVQAGPIGEWREQRPETKLVFIGTGMDEETMVADLEACLATDAELDSKTLADPFPA